MGNKSRLGKKGITLGTLQTAATLLVFVGLILGIGTYVNEQVGTTAFSANVLTSNCEAIAFITNNTRLPTTKPYIVSVSHMYNNSTCVDDPLAGVGMLIGTGNYTYDDYSILLTASSNIGAATKYINYSFHNDTEFLITKNTTAGIANLAQWLPIIAVVLAAGVVIGVIVLAFSGRKQY